MATRYDAEGVFERAGGRREREGRGGIGWEWRGRLRTIWLLIDDWTARAPPERKDAPREVMSSMGVCPPGSTRVHAPSWVMASRMSWKLSRTLASVVRRLVASFTAECLRNGHTGSGRGLITGSQRVRQREMMCHGHRAPGWLCGAGGGIASRGRAGGIAS